GPAATHIAPEQPGALVVRELQLACVQFEMAPNIPLVVVAAVDAAGEVAVGDTADRARGGMLDRGDRDLRRGLPHWWVPFCCAGGRACYLFLLTIEVEIERRLQILQPVAHVR